eukprot:m.197943 g.197943  ORF g.197943 m.197943 type:complete len:681 (+) comp32672_c0_seq1:75-2117(+)
MKFAFVFIVFVTITAVFCDATVLPPVPKLAPHPRLVLTPQRLVDLRANIAKGGDAAVFGKMLSDHATWALDQPPVPRGIAGPSGVLIAVRNSLDLMLTSAAAAALNGTDGVVAGAPFFDRALREANNLATNWSDWNFEQHALDTGEASFAMGLAYDWLYTGLTNAQRATLVAGITTKGLAQYRKYIGTKTAWWVNNTINWNCVCATGGTVATFAVLGDVGAPDWAYDEVAARLVSGVTPCVAAEHEDSSWEEGPSYWGYANKYNAWLFSSLESMFNSTLGLEDLPGVKHAARFPLYSSGANAVTQQNESEVYNWADAGSSPLWTPFASFWGTTFGDGAAAYFSRIGTKSLGPERISSFEWGGFVESMVFFDEQGSATDIAQLPTFKLYDYINMGVFRGPWFAPKEKQNYLGFKGGDTTWNHNHLDLGSFVFDMAGSRFAGDMGADSYALPGYFSDKVRWTYYRLNSHGHNVALFDNVSQVPATAIISDFNSTIVGLVDGWAIIDLTHGYVGASQPLKVRRGFVSLNQSSAIVIVDEYTFRNNTNAPNVSWQMHTKAHPSINGDSVSLLAQGSSKGMPPVASMSLLKSVTTCPTFSNIAVVDVEKLLPDPPYDSAKDWSRIDLLAKGSTNSKAERMNGACTCLGVGLGDPQLVATLASAAPNQMFALRNMDEWGMSGPLVQ